MNNNESRLLVGKPAPNFQGKAVVAGEIIDNFCLEDCLGKYTVLFFYPLGFTFVCPTELHAFQERIKDFEDRGTNIVACSVDSVFTHKAWLDTPRNKGGIQGVTYPILSDLTKNITRSYNILDEEEGIALRGLFLIDREGIIRHQLVNDLPIGRSVDEVIRTLDALIFHEEHGYVCPANWQKGKIAIAATQESVSAYLS